MTREERQKAINALKKSAPIMAMTQQEFSDYIQTINQVMDWLEQEPCEDAVSRTEVLNLVRFNAFHVKSQIKAIENMPSVTPQEPRKGHWVKEESPFGWDEHSYQCSECGRSIHLDTMVEDLTDYPYCHCGADMREVQEDDR